ncbi:MAG: UbiA family prenyltransferase [Candidatus Micrarchaeia archaeon]
MGEGYVRDVLEAMAPINASENSFVEVHDWVQIFIWERFAAYHAFILNVLEIMMPERSFTAVFALNAGLLMGGAFDFSTALLGSLAFVSTYACGAVYNNIRDIEADKINSASRPLASGALSVDFAQQLMVALASIGIALAYIASPVLAAACLLEALLGVVYSKYTKAKGILAYLTLVSTHMAVPVIAGSLVAGAFGIHALAVVAFLYVTEVLAVSIKDYKDIEGDKKTGLRTLPIILGPEKASRLTFFGLSLPLILVWLPWLILRLSFPFLGMYLVIGMSRLMTGLKILKDQSPKNAGEALNSFRLITTLEMLAWCLS